MVKWSVKIFFDRELHRMHLRKSSLQNSSALVQTLFLQKSTEKSLLIPMRSIKSAQCYISRTISRRQKFFCENRPIFGMVRDAEVRGGEEMNSAIFWIIYIVVLTVVSWISAKINTKSIREMVQLQFTIEKLKLRAEEMRRQLYDKDKE